MLETLALALVGLAGLYLCALGAATFLRPANASRFLLGLASSPRVHYIELSIRLLAGAALVIAAPRMFAPGAFSVFGWVLLVTTVCLLLLPWRWHRRFAQQAVPRVISYIKVIGVCSFALGALLLAAVIHGSAP